MPVVLPLLLAAALASSAAGLTAGQAIMAPAAVPPVVDGALDDACWARAPRLADFTRPESAEPPVQAVEARLAYDDSALYVGFTSLEADPGRMKARRSRVAGDTGVWEDDCVEVWIRSGQDGARFHQFIVGAGGLTETHYGPGDGAGEERDYRLRAAARIEADRWTCELAIPLAGLDLPGAPGPGELVELKLGREDWASGGRDGAALATWPPSSPYGRAGYGLAWFGRDNLLADGAFSGTGSAWSGTGPWQRLARAAAGSRQGVRLERGARLSQRVRLAAGSRYRLTLQGRGPAAGAVTVRSLAADDDTAHLAVPPAAAWQDLAMALAARVGGLYEVALQSAADGPPGGLALRDVRLAADPSRPAVGPALPVPADGALHLYRVVPVADVRAVRGFLHAPTDGTVDSRDWDGRFWEYPSPGPGAGVYYEHPNRNDGLHVTLADSLGVGAIQVRGGVRARVVAEAAAYDDSSSGRLVHVFPGRASTSLALFEPPVRARRLSFFGVRDGYLADVSFFRAADPGSLPGRTLSSPLAPGRAAALPGSFLADRFGPESGEVLAAFAPAGAAATAPLGRLVLAAGRPVHLVAGPWDADTAIAAVGLGGCLAGRGGTVRLTVQVQEPVHPRTAAATAILDLDGAGPLRLALDLPDLVLPAGTPLWVTLVTEAGAELVEPSLDLCLVPLAVAAPEASRRIRLKLAGCFAVLSEPRPWTGFRPDTDVDAFLSARGRLAPQLLELRALVDHARWLAPDDDVVRQYYEWFYRGRLRPALRPAPLPAESGAPAWAVAARAAWLAARAVPHWWLTHRQVPGGELGSGIGDDTDLYGNFVDFPFFETDGVAAELADGAARLAELVDRYQLEEGLNRMVTDPLHAYEEGANHMALMARWRYGDPVWLERCLDNARSTWALTTVNAAGHRHFKSQLLGAADLRFDRPTDVDGAEHPLMLHGVCEVAWYNRSPEAVRLLREWGDAWLAHQSPGAYATDVEVASDRVVGARPVPWTGGYGSQGEVFTCLYQATGDARYLEPVRRFWESGGRDPGLDERAIDLYRLGAFADAPALWQALAPRAAALQWDLSGDKGPLIAELGAAAAELATFGHLYTAAELFTDRVFLAAASRAPALAYTGGYGTRNKLFYSHGASWEGFGTQYAALVRHAGPHRFEALVYSFADRPQPGAVRLWNAAHGRYRLRLGPDQDGDDALDRAVVDQVVEVCRGEPIGVTLPPRQVTVIELVQQQALAPLWQRADLALSAGEATVRDHVVTGVVHNIGSDAAPAVVALVDDQGAVRARQDLGTLAAPLDLRPRRVAFRLAGVPDDPDRWRVVVDPDGRVPELYEGNNAVLLARPPD